MYEWRLFCYCKLCFKNRLQRENSCDYSGLLLNLHGKIYVLEKWLWWHGAAFMDKKATSLSFLGHLAELLWDQTMRFVVQFSF